MKLREKIKRFCRLDVHNHEGFTLVELIIVIAILAILSSVAVVGYSSYVKKANMQADKTLVAEIANALMLAYYADPNAGDMVVSVVLSDKGTTAEGDFAVNAMTAAYGSEESWKNMKLKYNGWGNGVAVSKEVLAFFMDSTKWDSALSGIFDGSANISYTDNIPELFDLLENTAILIAGKRESLGSGANMVTNAAIITNGMTIPEDYDGTATTPAEYFSELWASSAWDSDYLMNGAGSDYNADAGNLTDEKLMSAIANAGVIKARNLALATYLKDLGFDGAYDAIANYTYTDASGNATAVPDDAAGVILKSINDEDLTDEEWAFIGEVFPADDTEFMALASAVQAYYNSDNGQSQAYIDGLAYYAMMSTVDSLKDSENLDKTNDETWWNDLYSAVDMYAAIANGSVSVEDLNTMYSGMNVGNNTVVVMLMVVDGVPVTKAYPADLNP